MDDATAILLALLLPLTSVLAIALLDRSPNLREGVSLLMAGTLAWLVWGLLESVQAGERPSLTLFNVLPGLALAFEIEPLGMLFALVASSLWIIVVLYSIGYMRGNGEKNQTRFYMCFPIAIAASMGIAFAANMLTLFIFYEVLTLSTYPLVAHKQTQEARRGARTYLGLLMGTSIVFLLVAIVWTWVATGTLDFSKGGILAGHIDPALAPVLLALYVFGTGKAALMPFHRWLPAAMVAPTPVSALLHAVAVVKAGVFTVLKTGVYIFGIDYLALTGAANWLMWLAAASIVIASLVAISKDNLKARLAYSTVSQLSYITLGMALATSWGVIGGAMHIATHAMGKITLFMCAGAIYVATKKTRISDMDGLGRVMPFTFGAFLVGALSIIGLPPFAGAWSKWYLMLATVETHEQVMMIVLILSSLLNVAYLLPVVARGFFLSLPSRDPGSPGGAPPLKEAPLLAVVPPVLTAAGCLVLFFYAGDLYALVESIARTQPFSPEGAS